MTAGVPAAWRECDGELPTWELAADPLYYAEQMDGDSFAAWRGDQPVGEPGTYGTLAEAQEAAEAARANPDGAIGSLACGQCGAEAWISQSGTAHHRGGGPDDIDHDADADHVAVPG